jgi:hypothetical protein
MGTRLRRPLVTALCAVVVLLTAFASLLAPPVAATVVAPTQGTTTVIAPLPSDAEGSGQNVYVDSSTCPALNGCISVGNYLDANSRWWGVIWSQSGTSWTQTEAPEPSNAGHSATTQNAEFGTETCGIEAYSCNAISCPSASFCIAVGQYEDTAGYLYPLIDSWNGSTWSAVTPPALLSTAATEASTHEFSALQSVDCTSSTFCVAVGSYVDTAAHTEPLIETLNGTTWSALAAPVPSTADTTSHPHGALYNVNCASASFCVATGVFNDMADYNPGLLEQWNGTSWTALPAPAPSNVGTDGAFLYVNPYSAACASATACQVVGSYDDTSGHQRALIDSWNGTAWSANEGPEPNDHGSGADQFAQLEWVSCPSATSCVAGGEYVNTGGREVALLDSLSAGTWTGAAGPQPSNGAPVASEGSILYTVDCPTVSYCVASGNYEVPGSQNAPLLETYSAGTWTATEPPEPNDVSTASGAFAYAKSVACYGPSSCAFTGTYKNTSGQTEGFLDTSTGVQGYWLGASDGGIFAFGNAQFEGSTGNIVLNKPIVGMAATPDGQGYWLVASDGGVFTEGDAGFYGSTGNIHLNKPIVGMAATPDGKGYWLVASDGGVFTEGDAQFYGSTGNIMLNKPIVGMAATPDGGGYWLVASDGGIFAEGDATFYGSTGALHLNKPIVGMAANPDGNGYWLVASDGGIFAFGAAPFYGSTGNIVLNKPIVGMASTPSGLGYWLVASDGGIFTEGDAQFYGSTGALVLNKPIIGMAT